jgi:hypothetical protein
MCVTREGNQGVYRNAASLNLSRLLFPNPLNTHNTMWVDVMEIRMLQQMVHIVTTMLLES